MKTLKLFLALSVVSFNLSAQVEPSTPPKGLPSAAPVTVNHARIKIKDVYIQTGFFIQHTEQGTLADFKTLAPQSVLLATDLSDYYKSIHFGINSQTMFTSSLGINFSDKAMTTYKSNPQLRLGISYLSSTGLANAYYKEVRKPFDTLTSTQTGQNIYIDSVTSESYSMDYTSQQLRLDASLIFRTNPELRWSLYGGIGLTAGGAINAFTTVSYSINKSTQSSYSSNNTTTVYVGYNSKSESKSERFDNKSTLGFSAFLPLGVDFRMGKKREFGKRLHLHYELKPGINITSISELRTFMNAGLQHGFGLRITLS